MRTLWKALIAIGVGAIFSPLFLLLTVPVVIPRIQFWYGEPMFYFSHIVMAPALSIGVYLTLDHLWTRTPDAETRCRQCGYILRGLSEARCPECGERI